MLDNEFTGFSVTVIPKDVAEDIHSRIVSPVAVKSSMGLKISEVPNPVVFAVSLVHKPCVSGAKFCNIENLESENMENKDTIEKIKDILSMKSESKEETPIEYATKSDLDEMEEKISNKIVEAVESLTQPRLKTASKSCDEDKEKKEKEDSSKNKESSKNTENDNDDDSSNEDENEENEKKVKMASKSSKVHNFKEQSAFKSNTSIVYDIMGRDMTGSILKK